MARLLVSHRCAVGFASTSPTNSRFHDGTGLQVSHPDGYSLRALGQGGAADARVVALPISTLRSTLGARPLQKIHPAMGSARFQPLAGHTCVVPRRTDQFLYRPTRTFAGTTAA